MSHFVAASTAEMTSRVEVGKFVLIIRNEVTFDWAILEISSIEESTSWRQPIYYAERIYSEYEKALGWRDVKTSYYANQTQAVFDTKEEVERVGIMLKRASLVADVFTRVAKVAFADVVSALSTNREDAAETITDSIVKCAEGMVEQANDYFVKARLLGDAEIDT